MRIHPQGLRSVFLAAACGLLVCLADASAWGQAPPARPIPGRYIVVLKDPTANPATVAGRMSRTHGAAFDHVYGAALRGFAGTIPPGRLAAIRADPQVAYVEPDQEYQVQGKLEAVGKPGGGGGAAGEVVPRGVQRIYGAALIPSQVNVTVAVLDTGIQSNHPDLNVVGGVDFTRNRRGWQDGHGHGTHVAGTIGAIKGNGAGVVGVAPGTPLFAVKVLDDRGSGQNSWVIAGIDWVAQNANAPDINIRVANMSLGGGNSQAILDALDGAVASNVAFAVAAGNSSTDCRNSSPANSTNLGVATVSALSAADDTFASFSNNGRNEPTDDITGNGVDVIAPGVNVYSTYKGSGYATMSGTSMASPHVAGVAALIVAAGLTTNPAEIKQAMLTSPGVKGVDWDSYPYPNPASSPDYLYYYYGLRSWRASTGDLDSAGQAEGYEPLVNAGAFVP